MSDTFYLTFPGLLPDSFNKIGASGNWRAWQAKKKQWEARLVDMLCAQAVPQHTGMFARTTAILTVPDKRRRDAGNFGVVLEKALGDALQRAGVIEDDTPEYWSWTSVTFSHEPRVKATTIVLSLTDPLMDVMFGEAA